MLEFLPTREDVIAVRVAGEIQREELESMVDRLLRSLDAHELTHVFVEVTQLAGLELEGMAGPLRRSLPVMGKLRKFGRIAVVADQSWLRWASRVESALLPYVSYEVCTPQEREGAWRWVLGEQASPHAPA